MTTYNIDKYIGDITNTIKENHGIIAQLNKDIEAKIQENIHLLSQLAEAIKYKQTMKTLKTLKKSSYTYW